jgi:tetratricopeptide (TPR) repeat protein
MAFLPAGSSRAQETTEQADISCAPTTDEAFYERLRQARADAADHTEETRRAQVQAQAFLAADRPQAALDTYLAALEIVPEWALGHFNLALVAARLERYPLAIAAMRRFLHLEPSGHPAAADARSAQDRIYEWEALQQLQTAVAHTLVIGQRRSFEAAALPGQFVQHESGLGEVGAVDSPVDRSNSTYMVVRGLSGTAESITFESINNPGRYLRHQGFRLKLHRNDGSGLFRNDASFIPRAGLGDSAGVSFESVNFPGFFIRHRNAHLHIMRNDGSERFAREATFRVSPPVTAGCTQP